MQRFARCTTALIVLALALCLVVGGVSAQEGAATPWTDADSVRRMLFSAQAALLSKDASGAQENIDEAQVLYTESLQAPRKNVAS